MKIINYFRSLLLILAVGSSANAQGDFTNIYGSAGNDTYTDMYQATDGNLHVVGRVNLQAYYAKLNSCGVVLCEKVYSYPDMTYFQNLIPTDDGNFLAIGNPSEEYMLVKISPCGDVIWSKRYTSNRLRGVRLVKGDNDTYFLVSWYAVASTSDDVLITKIDAAGNFVWASSSVRIHNIDDQTYMAVADGSGGITVTGGLHGGGRVDMFVVNVDANGSVVADKEFESVGFYEAPSIVRTNDGGYASVARASTSASFVWDHVSIKKMDASFNVLWTRDFAMGVNYSGRWITEDSDGNIYVSTRTNWSGASRTTLIKLSSAGTVLSAKSFTDAADLVTSPVEATTNDIFAFGSPSFGSFGSSDNYLMKMDGNMNVCNSVAVTPVPANLNVTSQDWITSVSSLNLVMANATVVASNPGTQFIDICGTCAPCPANFMVDAGPCQVVYPGYGPMTCVTLTATVSGGVAPYTYQWDNAAMSTTASISACPSVTTTYTVTVTDANGCTTQGSVTVNAVNVSCGNKGDKVQVCHIPPGNPGNPQVICIAPSAVPAHINPGIGHSSGCHLGPCGAINPCTGMAPTVPGKQAIVEMDGTPSLIIYPSILVDNKQLTVEYSGLDNGVVIDVYSMDGSRVLHLPQSIDNAGDQHVTIDLNKMLSGVYLLKIQDESGNELMERFTIAK